MQKTRAKKKRRMNNNQIRVAATVQVNKKDFIKTGQTKTLPASKNGKRAPERRKKRSNERRNEHSETKAQEK